MRTTRLDRHKNRINTYKAWVYGLYRDKVLVYVGVTADPACRVESHTKRKTFDEFRLLKGFSSRDRAEHFENFCIQYFPNLENIVSLEPKRVGYHNRAPGFAKGDLERFLSQDAPDFDFNLLENRGIAKRKRWEERLDKHVPIVVR